MYGTPTKEHFYHLQTRLLSNNCPAYRLSQPSLEMFLEDVCWISTKNVIRLCHQLFRMYSIPRIAPAVTNEMSLKVHE